MCLVSCRVGFLGGDILLSTFPGKDGPVLCITVSWILFFNFSCHWFSGKPCIYIHSQVGRCLVWGVRSGGEVEVSVTHAAIWNITELLKWTNNNFKLNKLCGKQSKGKEGIPRFSSVEHWTNWWRSEMDWIECVRDVNVKKKKWWWTWCEICTTIKKDWNNEQDIFLKYMQNLLKNWFTKHWLNILIILFFCVWSLFATLATSITQLITFL